LRAHARSLARSLSLSVYLSLYTQDLGRPLVQSAFNGQTCLLFAHGACGSGKTHALTGTTLNPGISTRLFCEVFDMLALKQTSPECRRTVTVSYTEIYDDKVLDLLSPETFTSRRSSREPSPATSGVLSQLPSPATSGVLNLDGVSEVPVWSAEDMCRFKDHGDHVRRTVNRRLSCCSASLSHAVFSIRIGHSSHAQNLRDAPPGHIHIIDLASSNVSAHLHRHYCREDPPTREMMSAAAAVDATLSDLCLALHSASSREVGAGHHESDPHIPVAENLLLNRLLRGQHWNQTQCVLLACVTPANTAYQETVTTLEFASRCSAMKGGPCSSKGSRARVLSDHGHQSGEVREKLGRMRHQEAALAGGEREGSSGAAVGVENEAVSGFGAFAAALQQQKLVLDEIALLNEEIASASALNGRAGDNGSGVVRVGETQRRVAARQEHLHHLTAVVERERQTLKKSWELVVRAAAEKEPLHDIRHSTLGKMKVSEIVEAVLPHHVTNRILVLEQVPRLEAQISEARIAFITTKTIAVSQRAALINLLKALNPTEDRPHNSLIGGRSSAPHLSTQRTLQVACKRAGELLQSWTGLNTLRGRGVDAAARVHDLLTDLLDEIMLLVPDADSARATAVKDALSAVEDIEYARSRVANLRARISTEDVTCLHFGVADLEMVEEALATGRADFRGLSATEALASYGAAGGAQALERMLTLALDEHARRSAAHQDGKREAETARLRHELDAALKLGAQEREQREAACGAMTRLKTELGELLRQHQILLPQVQRQLDSVARRRSLEMHQYHQQRLEHRQEQEEWREERHALQAKLEKAVADLARARCDVIDAKAQMQKLFEELKSEQAAAASAVDKAETKNLQLQGVLALCRRARSAESPAIKAAQAQASFMLALHEQVSTLDHTLQQSTRALHLHSSLLREGPTSIRRAIESPQVRQEHGNGVGLATGHRGDTTRSVKRDLPVFERLFQAAADLSVEQVRMMSLGGGERKETEVDWVDAEKSMADQMRRLLHSIVAASNEAVAIDNALTASRTRVEELEGRMHKLQLRAAHMTVDAGKSCTSTPVPCSSDLKREHEHETDEEMAIKVLAARATAQNEKAKRKAVERKMRACSRELDSRKRFTPKRAPSREGSSQILSPTGSLCEEHSPSSQPGQQLSHARDRSGWKPNVTKVLEAQSGVAGRRLNPKLLWHIEVRETQTDTDPDADPDSGTDTGTDTDTAALPKEEEELLGMSGKHVAVLTLRCDKKLRQQHDAHEK
jgi:hypothetical protein